MYGFVLRPRSLALANKKKSFLCDPGLIATGQPMQLYAPQPFAANGHQPYAVMPTDIPLMQPPPPPFPITRSMQIPVPNGFYGTKFL